MKKLIAIVAAVLALGFAAVLATMFLYLADIRPPQVDLSDVGEAKARALLKGVASSQGLTSLKTHQTLSLDVSDHWVGFMGKGSNPWHTAEQDFRLDTEVHSRSTRLELTNGPHAKDVWIVSDARQVTASLNGGPLQATKGTKLNSQMPAEFMLPTVRFFLLLAFELESPEFVGYAGEAERDGRHYDVVYLSWGSSEANESTDQYVVYIDQSSKQIGRIEFTVREQMRSSMGTARYYNYTDFDGVQLPKSVVISAVFPGGAEVLIHTLGFDRARFDEVTTAEIQTPPQR